MSSVISERPAQPGALQPNPTSGARCWVHQLFTEQARRSPEATAIVVPRGRVSYRELDQHSNRVARQLLSLGAGSDVVVGLHVERSIEMVVGVLAVLKAGAAYLPLDTNLPDERLRFMADDADVRVLLTQRKFASRLASPERAEVFLDGEADRASAPSDEPLHVNVQPLDLAYVIYTSGSTGKPKGVMVSHHGLMNYLLWAADAYRQAELDGAVIATPLAFDATVTSLFAPLISGRAVHLPGTDRDEFAQLASKLGDPEARLLFKLTPAHLGVLQTVHAAQVQPGRGHVLVVGGEALFPQQLELFRALNSDRKSVV